MINEGDNVSLIRDETTNAGQILTTDLVGVVEKLYKDVNETDYAEVVIPGAGVPKIPVRKLKLAKYEWSEIFMSIEGEAKYNGHPTVYVRFARCNFQCPLFNNPNKEVEKDGYASLGFEPKDFATLESIPLLHKGCDSQYAVNPKFAHMWHKGDENKITEELLQVLPHHTFKNPKTNQRTILSLTGGEPTVRIKFWFPLLDNLYTEGMRHILVETNCASPLKADIIDELYDWISLRQVRLTWSNSPKLTSSGESWKKAIRPEIAMAQRTYHKNDVSLIASCAKMDQYFKFVCGPTAEDFDEVEKAMTEYHAAGVPTSAEVYIMPVACTEEQQQKISAMVAAMCIDRGYIYCHRIQNSVFGNGVGT